MTKKRIATLVLIALVPILFGAGIAGFSIWHDSMYYVKASSARVSGDVVQVSAPGSGEVVALPMDVGEAVQRGQTLARLDITMTTTPGVPSAGSVLVPVKAPVAGTIIKRFVQVGEHAAAGAPIVSLVDLSTLYVVAEVDESRAPVVQVGQPATIYLRAFDKTVPGWVSGTTPATSDLVTVLPPAQQANSVPRIPVLLTFDTSGLPVYPGMSADVSIQVR